MSGCVRSTLNAALLTATFFLSTSSSALTISLSRELDTGATGPYATLTISEVAGDLDFVLSLAGTTLGADADLHELYFNLVGSPTGLAISSTNAPTTAYVLLASPPIAGGAGSAFEHGVSFGNGAGPSGNGVLKTASFRLSADQSLTIASLLLLSQTSAGLQMHVAAHVQGTSLPGATSETVGGIVPEPTTMLLVGAGLAGLSWSGRRRTLRR